MHASENPHVAAQLRNLVYYSLDNDLLQNALFHAGRLHGLDTRNGDASHLIALCHFRMGQYKAAHDYSRDKGLRGNHLGCAYVFAQSCLALQRFVDGITALERSKSSWVPRNHWNKHSETSRRHIPDAAAVHYLMGKLWLSYGDSSKAVDHFVESLKLNPFMWESFSELCNTGAKIKASNVFRLTSEMLASIDAQSNSIPQSEAVSQNLPLQPHVNGKVNGAITPGNDPFNTRPKVVNGIYGDVVTVPEPGGPIEWETPLGNGTQGDDDVTMDEAPSGEDAPPAILRKPSRGIYPFQSDLTSDIPRMRAITTRSRTKAGSETSEGPEPVPRPTSIPISHKRTVSGQVMSSSAQSSLEPPGAPQRRSDRVRNRILPATSRIAAAMSRDTDSKDKFAKRDLLRKPKSTSTKGKTVSTVGRVVSGNRKPLEPTDRDGKDMRPSSVASTNGSIKEIPRRIASQIQEISPQKEALVYLLDQYGKIGHGYFALSRYDCHGALNFFDTVSISFRDTPWVLAQIGRAYFEKSSYNEAEQIFSKIKKMVPSRTEDMEIYSTVLWHLHKDVELAYISHELIETDRLSPQAWCALGNAFSLQGEHDQAVKCFRRATQLDPKFAYAFTLTGHEYVANEEFDKALLVYRHAISADNRHYNGWYGLGQVFEKLGKYDIARDHYMTAARINPTNPVLKVCIGLVLEKTAIGTGVDRNKRRELALSMYNEACELDPRSYKARFYKARVLLTLSRPAEALKELEELKNMKPDDSAIHFLLGKIYRYCRNKSAAIRHFTIAMNLDPKSANVLKEALERVGDSDDDEELDDEDMD